jgi:hypothetical protein
MDYTKEEQEIIIKILSNFLKKKVMYDKNKNNFLSSSFGGFWNEIPDETIKEASKQAKETISKQEKEKPEENNILENIYEYNADSDDVENDDEDEDSEEQENSSHNGFYTGLIVGIIIVSLIWGIGKKGKYEGQTAEEWFNEYDDCQVRLEEYQSCVEDTIPNINNYCPSY